MDEKKVVDKRWRNIEMVCGAVLVLVPFLLLILDMFIYNCSEKVCVYNFVSIGVGIVFVVIGIYLLYRVSIDSKKLEIIKKL